MFLLEFHDQRPLFFFFIYQIEALPYVVVGVDVNDACAYVNVVLRGDMSAQDAFSRYFPA